jgi:hypothetical protein
MARDWKLTGILTGTALNCGPQPGGTSPALGWSVKAVKTLRWGGSAGYCHSWTSDKNTAKNVCQKVIFCGHVRSSKRFERRFCRKRYLKINK